MYAASGRCVPKPANILRLANVYSREPTKYIYEGATAELVRKYAPDAIGIGNVVTKCGSAVSDTTKVRFVV